MKLYKIRGGTLEELNQKKYTIGVGISLDAKWFNLENILESIKWALPITRDRVVVYVADSIHAINLEVRKRVSFEKASEMADKKGNGILRDVKLEIEKKFLPHEVDKIVYAKWRDIVNESYRDKLIFLRAYYKNNDEFKKKINLMVKGFTLREERKFSDADIERFGEYVIEEMPELINRVKMAGYVCDAYMYPFDGDLTRFIEKVQKGEVFPEIKKNVMDTDQKVFLEVR